MKMPGAIVLAAVMALAAGYAQTLEITEAPGAIREVNARNGWYAIVPDADRDTRSAPDRLPDDYRKDGLRVIFGGRVGEIDPSVRTWGIPLELTKIALESPRP